MSKSDTNAFNSSSDQKLSPEEQAILRANQTELHYITGTTETAGLIQDNKRVLLELQRDIKNIIGHNINNILLVLLLLFYIGVYNDLNWHLSSVAQISGSDPDKITTSNLTNSDPDKNVEQADRSLIDTPRDYKINSSGLTGSAKYLLDSNNANGIVVRNNDPVSLLPTNNRICNIENALIKPGNNYLEHLVIINAIQSVSQNQSSSRVCKVSAFRNLNSSTEFSIKCQIILESTQAKNELVDNEGDSYKPSVITKFNCIFKNDHSLSDRH